MGNLSCGNLDPPPSSGGQSAASSPSALHEDGLTKRFRRCRSPFREPPKSDRHPVGMVMAIISESRSASVRNRDRHHLGTLIAIARNTHAAASSQESYGHAIDEFIGWYCSEPRLAFNRTVVLRYRFFLEQKNLAPATINVRLAAVRRLAYEASDTGILSSELAAGIRRVKGAKRLGVRIGNWLTIDQARTLLDHSSAEAVRAKRDQAILAVLVGCGLRRAELAGLKAEDFQIRQEHWVVADLIGKGKHMRTVPVPGWVKRAIDAWIAWAEIRGGTIFRRVNRMGKVWGDGITPKAIWHIVKGAAQRAGIKNPASML